MSKLVYTKNLNMEKINFNDQSVYKNLSHLNKLVKGVDLIGQMHNLSMSNEVHGQWLVIPNEESSSQNSLTIIATALESFKNWIWSSIKNSAYVLLGICVSTIFVFLLIKYFFLRLIKQRKSPIEHRKEAKSLKKEQVSANIEMECLDLNVVDQVPNTIILEPKESASISTMDKILAMKK